MLSHLQEKLYAQDRWALLLIFQAMDAAGKDSAIKHVMSGVNPQGCQVVLVQGAVAPRSSTTTSCGARTRPSARARPDRHLQPLLLRGGARRPRAPGAARAAEAAASRS